MVKLFPHQDKPKNSTHPVAPGFTLRSWPLLSSLWVFEVNQPLEEIINFEGSIFKFPVTAAIHFALT